MNDKKSDAPRECEMHIVNCKCDYCGKSLDKLTRIWIWNEHFGCSRNCVQMAQAKTNRTFKQNVEERDIDLL
jgi:hypothetical protein